MTDGKESDGLVVVDKPAGWTSHDVVGKLRRLAGTRRVGHAGTLDPMATGVLVVGINKATRLLGHLALKDKAYDATIRLGVTTTTDDAEGEETARTDAGAVTDTSIAVGMKALTGDIEQVPSAVSAIKIDGVRAYKRVRDGETVELKARSVTVSKFDLLERRGGDLQVQVECSTGTYVRALARDLGAALGVGGHLTSLRRTRVGGFDLSMARTIEQLEDDLAIMGLAEAVESSFRRVDVSAEDAQRISYGQGVELSMTAYLRVREGEGPIGVFDPDGSVVALASNDDLPRVKTLCVFR